MKRGVFFVILSVFAVFGASAQKISGKVFDENTKETLPYCNVYWLEGGGGAITDNEGVFVIQKKNNKQTKLVFSYTGYANDTVLIGEKTSVDVALKSVGTTLGMVEIKE
ncbi:MAG: carboxypeptidase-like regulatory domain-containing protein, partial [Bacteroidales bacterium]|nr:carboxypeptidase-like regulatory domain-containing protein [Bacteroidales bacterium]